MPDLMAHFGGPEAGDREWYHGTPDVRHWHAGRTGIHIGTREAAKQALEARIGAPAEGEWDGTREYGPTPLRSNWGGPQGSPGSGASYRAARAASEGGDPDIHLYARHGNGDKIADDARPHIFPVRLRGPMTNTPDTPHEDFKANGLMAGQLKRGRAKSGYFYRNVSEDEGSISAVVPSAAHLERLDEPKTAGLLAYFAAWHPGPQEDLLAHFAAVGDPAVPEAFANPYHGTERFGGNPEFSHTWFHGTRGSDPDLRPGRPLEDQRGGESGRGWPQPNKLLGTHFSPLHRVAHRFAKGVYPSRVGGGSPGVGSALVHARLHMRDPAHFPTEKHLNIAVARWADDNSPDWHNDKLNKDMAWQYSDTEGTHRDWHAEPHYDPTGSYEQNRGFHRLAEQAQRTLQWHPKLPQILHGFTDDLIRQGHHGITYGNEVEGPGQGGHDGEWDKEFADHTYQDVRHISAIATRPSQIETTHVEHIAPPQTEPEPHEVEHHPVEPRYWGKDENFEHGRHGYASELNEDKPMYDRVGAFHAGHGGAYPGHREHREARFWPKSEFDKEPDEPDERESEDWSQGWPGFPHEKKRKRVKETTAVLPGGDLSDMSSRQEGARVEWVRTDALMKHREWIHGPGFSRSPEGEQMAPRHTPEEWAANVQSVKDEGIRQPIHVNWDPKSNYAYLPEGNSRLAWAAEAGHEAVPVAGHRHSWIPDRRAYKLPGPSKGPEVKERHGNHIPADISPSEFLPEHYMHHPGQGTTASLAMPSEYGDDNTAPPEGEIHRGVSIWTAQYHPQVHQVIHDEAIPARERAAHLMQHLGPRLEKDKWGGGGVGKHWSTSEKTAQGFATHYEHSAEHPWHEFHQDPGVTRVVFHAAPPKASHMITSPRTKMQHDILPTTHGEREVPLRNRAPVTVTGVSWSVNAKDAPWTRHDFPQPIRVKASAPAYDGPYYHGTAARLSPGNLIEPGHKGHDVSSKEHVYLAASDSVARTFGGLAAVRNKAKTYSIYRVEPTGPVEPDPDGMGHRTRHPLRVITLHERGASPEDPNPWWNQPGTGKGYPRQAKIIDMASSSGDRHVTCARGHEHWGAYGAAGLLIRHKGEDGQHRYLLQKRSPYVNEPDTWSIPGGAIGKHESPEAGAWREAREEMGSIPRHVTHHHTVTSTDCGDWKYHTVVADAKEHFMPGGRGETQHETAGVGWHTAGEIEDLRDSGDLHPGFAKSWESVRRSRGPKTAAALYRQHVERIHPRDLLPYAQREAWRMQDPAGKRHISELAENIRQKGYKPSLHGGMSGDTHGYPPSFPITLVHDDENSWLWNGHHRTFALNQAGYDKPVPVLVKDFRTPKTAVLHPDTPDYAHGMQSGGSQVEWVRRERLRPYMEFHHDRETGQSTYLPTGHTFPDRYNRQRWDEMDSSVAEHGMHEPVLLEYNPWTRKMHIGEGHHRLESAERAGHEMVPVWGLKTSREHAHAKPVPGEPKVTPEHFAGGYFPSSFKPSDVLPASWMKSKQEAFDDEWRHPTAVITPGSLPPAQQHAFDTGDHREHSRQMFEVAKHPEPGTRVWRGEIRRNDEDPETAGSVGMHWSASPDPIITGWAPEGHKHVVWQGIVEHHDEQAFPRGHPIWSGRHQSFDHEAEVRFRPGASVKLEGAYVHEPKEYPGGLATSPGHLVPRIPERTHPDWKWHPLDRHITIRHSGHGASDYSELGILREAVADPAMVP